MKKIMLSILVIGCVLALNSCKKKISGCIFPNSINYNANATDDDGSCISVGDPYEGGILAYIFKQGDPGFDENVKHGLIAAPYDQSTYIQWTNDSAIIASASSSAIGAGKANTDSIVAHKDTGNYAAKICFNLVLNGYNDWVLPSKDELNILYANKAAIKGFDNATYWSSTELGGGNVWIEDFTNGQQSYVIPWSTSALPNKFYVRAIRYF